ncbi:hypothetical protein K120096G11_30780 [Thomasclavelia ramosa]
MLELKDVSVVFNEGTVNEKVALNNINLALDKGDFVTIIGSNGAGKSLYFKLFLEQLIQNEEILF